MPDITIESLENMYNRIMMGDDTPDEIMWNAGGLKQFAEKLPEPKRTEMIAFADACPSGSICVMSRNGSMGYLDVSELDSQL